MPEDDSLPASTDPIAWYDLHAGEVVNRYESPAPEKINDWFRAFLPGQPGFILDVGAGSGRDAAWLASLGHEVIAVEPSDQLRARAQELHAGVSGITWINDRLPGLEKVHRLGVSFDFILLNAVWMHVPPASRQPAFRKLITLLKPGGRLAISFRQPDPDRARSIFACHMDEFEKLARDHGSIIEKWDTTKDEEIRPDIEWTRLIITLRVGRKVIAAFTGATYSESGIISSINRNCWVVRPSMRTRSFHLGGEIFCDAIL